MSFILSNLVVPMFIKKAMETKCVQCGAGVSTPFCPDCGQRAGVKRLTIRDTLEDSWNNIIGLDGIFLRTLKDLTRRPAYVALSYIAGIRMRYFGPIAYFFFMITLLLLWSSILGIDFADIIRAQQEGLAIPNEESNNISESITRLFSDQIRWVLFLAVPFQAIAARYFLFRKSGYNLVEHTVPLFYTNGHMFWLTMLMVVVRKFTGEMYSVVDTVLSLTYFGYVYMGLMKYQSRTKAFLKGVVVYFSGLILFILTMIIVSILFLILLKVFDPEAFKALKA